MTHRGSGVRQSNGPANGPGRGRFLSLQARITLSVGLAIALILAAFSFIATWAVRDTTSAVLQNRLQVAQVVAARIAESLSDYRHALEDLAWELSRQPDPRQQGAILEQAGEGRRFTALALLAPDGRVIWSRPAWFGHAVPRLSPMLLGTSPGNAVALPPLEALPGARLTAFVLPVGGSSSLLAGAVDLALLRSADLIPGNDSRVLDFEITDPDGGVVASSQQSELGRLSEHLPVIIMALARRERAGVFLHNVPGHPHYVAHTPLPGYPGWSVNVEQPRDLVLSLPHSLRNRLAVLGLILLAGMSGLAFLDVRSVVRPLMRLREAADHIAGGDLDHAVTVDRRDEVGALARTFEAMRVKLKASRDEIAAWNRTLEDRVAERTRELTAMAEENARLFALARREERNLASTVDLLSDGLLTLGLDRRILSLNPAAERLLGWRSEEARGLACTELLECPGCPAGHVHGPCVIQEALEGSAIRGIRIQARRRGGGTFPAVLTAGIGRDEAERPTHYIITVSDMTKEEAYERQIQRRIRQLTALHEIARALSLVPLRTVEETARDVVQRVAAVTGGRCRLDLEPRGHPAPEGVGPAVSFSAGGRGTDASVPEEDAGTLQRIPLVLQGRRMGTLGLDPGSAERAEGDPAVTQIIASQVAVAMENAALYEDVRDRDALRRQLLERIVIAQEEERQRIARELHDEIGQALTSLVMQLGTVETALPRKSAQLRDRLAGIRTLTSQTVGEVRRLMLDLRPSVLDELGLVPAIRWYAESHLAPAGIEARVAVSGLDEHERLPRRLELVAFRLTQEAMTNVLRHAEATQVTVTLERKDGTLGLSIDDNGRGFDAERYLKPGRRGGWGLVGMHERVALLGGVLTVTSRPRHGTQVTATIPIGEEPDGN